MTEYVYCFDSFSAVPKSSGSTDPNPTNDIRLPVHMTANRLNVASIELATVEVPAVQFTIEDDWGTIYLSGGLPLTDATTSSRTLTITDSSYSYTAELPLVLNTIVGIDDTDVTAPIFETENEHLLSTAGLVWTFDDVVSLISTASDTPLTVAAGGLVSTVTVIDDTHFQVTGFAAGTAWKPNGSATTFGSVYYPQIPNPDILADLLEQLLQQSVTSVVGTSWDWFEVSYAAATGRFSVGVRPVYQTSAPAHLADAYLVVADGALAAELGFATGNYPLVATSVPLCAGPSMCRTERWLFSPARSLPGQTLGVAAVTLTPGDYESASELVAELNLQLNRFFFDSSSTHLLRIANTIGTVFDVEIPPGLYAPDPLATTITEVIAADTTLDVEVTFDPDTDQFTFTSAGGSVFALEFAETSTTTAAFTFGFPQSRHSGFVEYTSPLPIGYLPTGTDRYPSAVLTVTTNGSSELVVTTSIPPPIAATANVTGTDSDTLTVTGTDAAHGLQVGDLALVTISSVEYELEVTSVTSGTEYVAALGSLSLGIGVDEVVTSAMYLPPQLNLMFAPRALNSRLPAVLGFQPTDVLWTSSFGGSHLAPLSVNLTGNRYLLVEILDPIGSAQFEHMDGKGHNKATLIGKLVRASEYGVDRFYPMHMKFFGKKIITSLHLRLLNPDHTLYHLHGHSWSGTLRFYLKS